MFWQKDIELMPPEQLRELQTTRLRRSVAQAKKSPFYAKALAGVEPQSLNSPEDVRSLPFTVKKDMREHFPYGFLAVPRSQVVRLHASSGTTGTPTAILHSKADLRSWANLMARGLYMTGVRPSDVFQNLTGYGLFSGGLGMHYAAERLGTMVIPAGAGNSRRQILLMRQMGTTVMHIIPSYALRLAGAFAEQGLDPSTDSKLKIAIIGAEPHSEQTRKRVEELFGVKAYNNYGLSELNGPGVAIECPEQNGLHLWEDAFLLEVLDPVTMEPVEPGQVGELVLTTLERRAMPLIRYRTRDLAALLPGECACGRTHRRLSRIVGRSDDMFIIKGVNVYPMQVESVLMDFKAIGGQYLIVLENKGEADAMTVRAELSPEAAGLSQKERDGLARALAKALRDELLVTPAVEILPPGGLPMSQGKAERVQDRRNFS
ncbi:MAG: phenylacetate--CoA ligase [Desulfarculaceae bacterium]|nr:phenylacetate--CoA ligase [Desulfarculaceae bacterium]MCF8048161.1 phenylacetate--CoA ligase [Desulfarculaceae bacterium]MCF8065287.1 phenylacetate--CoA ligase [Desulfarculaceae bacterium]MCF8098816.1 phenylacetate--CoA ligase [Desulfarculaceae bacterium]MCF8123548.1 phenylacetate--CoA ligase [Desulfarculaceae bacterium]